MGDIKHNTVPISSYTFQSEKNVKALTAPSTKMKATSPPGARTNQGGLGGRRKLRSVATKSSNIKSPSINVVGGDLHHDLEADELESMERAVEAQQQALREKKDRFKRRQQQQMHKRADELQNRLKALQAAEKQERRVRLNMRTKLVSLREHDKEDNEEEKKIEENLWEFERDAQIEELTRIKMQIQQLHIQREKTEARIDANNVQVTAIEDVLLNRGNQDIKQLNAILSKADILKESMLKGEFERDALFKHQDQRDFATRVIEGTKGGDGDTESFKLSDEVEMRRRKEREQKKQERQEKLRELNEKRRAINEKQMENVRKEKDHRLLMERGLELLVDIELGVAPPLKYILENARDGDEEIVVESDIESDEEREVFISTIQHEIALIPKVIDSLEKEKLELEKEREWAKSETANMKEYQGELGARSYHPDQLPTFRICISIIEDLADKITDMLVNRPTEKDVKQQFENILYMKKQRETMREQNRLDRVVRLLNSETISEVVHDLAGSICVEYNEVHKRAKGSTKDLIIEAFDVSAAVRPMLKPVLTELIKRRENSDMQHASRIAHHSTKLKAIKKKNIGKHTEEKDNDDQQEFGTKGDIDSVDYDTSLTPDSDVYLDALKGKHDLIEMEEDFFGKFKLEWHGYDLPEKAGPATVACLSYNNRFIFTGHHKGAVLFWDCAHEDPLLIRQDLRLNALKTDQHEIVQATFGSGGGGLRVVCLDKDHVIRVWTTEVDSSGSVAKKSKKNKSFPADYHLYAKNVKEPQLVLVLRAKNFARQGADPKDLTDIAPTYVIFHTAMTITGQTPSLLCGLKGGVIVKYNLSSDAPVVFDEILGADVTNPVMRGKQLDTEERKSKSRLAMSGNSVRPDSEREFFQAHRHEIEFISRVGTSQVDHDPSSKFVSVDKKGCIMMWPYSKENYSGFGWFIPSEKYQLRRRYDGGEKRTQISMVECTMNASLTQLIILVHAIKIEDASAEISTMTGMKGDLEIFIFDVHNGNFVPKTITVKKDFGMTKSPPAMAMGPLIDPLASDYVFIICDGTPTFIRFI